MNSELSRGQLHLVVIPRHSQNTVRLVAYLYKTADRCRSAGSVEASADEGDGDGHWDGHDSGSIVGSVANQTDSTVAVLAARAESRGLRWLRSTP